VITIPTGDLCGILADCIPFASPDDDIPILNAVRLEWDGAQLHAMSTDRFRVAWSTWQPDDDPDTEGDQQEDLFTTWGGADVPWHIYLPLADAKDIVSNFKLKPKERGCPLQVDHADGQLKVDRSRMTGHSALRMVVAGVVLDSDGLDIRRYFADHATAKPVRAVAYTPKLLADFGKVRPRGALKLTFTGEHAVTLVEIGERFVGAIQPVKERDDE
jgi:hypothetical protein